MGYHLEMSRCEECGLLVPNYDRAILVSDERQGQDLCSACFNLEMARNLGIENFTNVCFDPVEMVDAAGVRHLFHFRSRIFGDMLTIEALELQEGEVSGYQFQVDGQPDDDQFVLLGRLIEKMRRALAVRYLVEDKQYGLQIANYRVGGRFDWDEETEGELPLLVIDGREVSWQELGFMLASYEGWQFKLEILDPTADAG